MLAEMVEKLQKTKLQAASSAHSDVRPGDVECDSCLGRKRKAVNSCLVCRTSFCEDHLQPHYESQAFKKHKLVEACADFQAKTCSEHNKAIEIFCRTDQSFICYLCAMDKHRQHDTVSTIAERTEKQNELMTEQMKSQQRSEEKKKKVQELKQTVDNIKKKRSKMTAIIRAQEKAQLSGVEELMKQLEQEIADLNRRVIELQQLSNTDDHVHFLQSFPSFCVSPGHDDSPSITVNQHLSYDEVKKSLLDLKKRVKKICVKEFNKFKQKDSHYLMLDPNTAYCKLLLSEKNRTVTCSGIDQRYSDHPERFDYWFQVLSKERVWGRCYWEVERSGNDVYIAVAYKEISRKGGSIECVFGRNSQSWSLQCSSSSFYFWHNNIETELQGPVSSRIGVYVDYNAGTLSFYSVSDTMRLLHKVHTTFTQPLYAGFYTFYNSTVKLCDTK
ncbi:finTRIM family, member 14 [Silurus meridionalis]|nr:finTRIM family, member 14 [Silurus meridionalis]